MLLSIDPLAELALFQDQLHQRLLDLTPTDCSELRGLWQEAQQTIDSALDDKPRPATAPHDLAEPEPEPQYLVLIPCRDERQQTELLSRFLQEGLPCKALIS